MEKTCPLCGVKFICRHDNITECQCSKIRLSNEDMAYIKSKFANCLCIDCLRKIAEERKKQEKSLLIL